MRIAIVGPTHPYKGGITQHTTEMSHRLKDLGHEVDLVSWKAQYPFFYPGVQFVPEDKPELPIFESTSRKLSWKNPVSWAAAGRQLKKYDMVVLVWWVPTIQGPIYRSILNAMGKGRSKVVVICHNVLPHESKPADKILAKAVLGRVGRVITHSDAQRDLAETLTRARIERITLPLPLRIEAQPKLDYRVKKQLLFFGFVRHYKGLDILLKALANVPDVKLQVAGEFWNNLDEYKSLVDELGLSDRVTIQDGYVPTQDFAGLFRAADAVVLPYRHGTASFNVYLAHAFGLPVISTTAGTLGDQVKDGIDGLLCKPDDVESLATALKQFYKVGIAAKLQAAVPTDEIDRDWDNYIKVLIGDMT